MNKLVSQDAYFAFVSIVLIVLSLGGMIHYQNKSKMSQSVFDAVVKQSLKNGVNKDSLKKAIYSCDTLR